MENVSAKPRRIPLWKWGWAAWLLAVIAFVLLSLFSSTNIFFEDRYGYITWAVIGLTLASCAIQSLRFPILPWLYGFPHQKNGWRIALSTIITVGFFAYFLVGLINAFGRWDQFGSPLAPERMRGLVYDQVMLPNGYEFGIPDIFAAFILAGLVDLLFFSNLLLKRAKVLALFAKGVVLNAFLFVGTIFVVLEAIIILSYIVAFTSSIFNSIYNSFS